MVVDWVKKEFASLDLGHRKREDRVRKFVSQASAIGQSTPDRTRNKADLKGVYRLTDNPKVATKEIFGAHHQAARKRSAGHSLVYLAQDTTEFDLTKPKQQVTDAGPLGTAQRRGFFYHPLYALDGDGVSLGVVDQVLWTRDPASLKVPAKQRAANRKQQSFEEKESSRWLEMMQSGEQIARSMPQTHFVMLADSEADMAELLSQAGELPENYDFIIRQCRTENILDGVDPQTGRPVEASSIDEALAAVPWRGEKTVPVGGRDAPVLPDDKQRARKQARTSREALIQFRAVRVKLAGPRRPGGGKLPDVWINIVEALEVDPPAGESPVRWVLLTTLPVETVEQIDGVLVGYCFRWPVELYFKTLKSGLKIEDMKYETLERYVKAFSMLAVVAWRVEHLKGACRHASDSPCTEYFSEHEWMAVMIFLHGRDSVDASTPPTMGHFMKSIAKLGGYIDKKAQGPPGSTTIWRGMSRFETIVEAFLAFR